MRSEAGRGNIRRWVAGAVPAAALAAAMLAPAAGADVAKDPREDGPSVVSPTVVNPNVVRPNVVRPAPVPPVSQGPSSAPRGPVASPASPAAPAPSSSPAQTGSPAPSAPAPGPGYGVDDLPFPTTSDCNLGCQRQWYSHFAKEDDPLLSDFLGLIANNVKELASDLNECNLACQRDIYRQFEYIRVGKGGKDPSVRKVLDSLEKNMDQWDGEDFGREKPFDGEEWGTGPSAEDDDGLLGIPDFLKDLAGLSGVENAIKDLVDALTGGSSANCAQPKTDDNGNSYCMK